jgi:hypothetical protein
MVLDIITYALCRKNGGGGGGGDNTHFIGTTTTAITDGATTNPITVDGESYTAVKGDIVIYNSTEFIFDGSAWQSFGGTMDTQPTKNSAKAVTSDGVYRYTAGQKEYTNNILRGEIFNTYSGNDKNIASGDNSHAEGQKTYASGVCAHTEGYNTSANGNWSHAQGVSTSASGHYSHAGGIGTQATEDGMTVIGKFNNPKTNSLFEIGNGSQQGSTTQRSNILEVSDTYLNLNGIFKQNGQVIDFSTLGDEIVEMSDIEYDALVTKDPDKVYFVYEAEENSGTITPKPNGFKRIYKGNELYATNELPDITPHVELTQSQYDALVNPDEDTEYFITDSEAEGDFSDFETRMSRIEQEFIVYYQNGNQRIPLYTENIKKVIKIDNNTVEWYIDDPDTGKHYKAIVTAEGQGNVRTNPQISVVEVV